MRARLLAALLLAACSGEQRPVPPARPVSASLPVRRGIPRPAPRVTPRVPARAQRELDALVAAAIARGDVPGVVVVAGNRDGTFYRRAWGLAAVEPAHRPLRADAVFDLASVTKAVATATSVAALVEAGKLAYDEPVARTVRAFDRPDKRAITLRQLLEHTSGLPADNAVDAEAHGLDAALADIARLKLRSPPGARFRYSDLGFIALGAVVERAAGEPLDAFAHDRLFARLGMRSTRFRPGATLRARAVPTVKLGDRWLVGAVHDPRARALGGVAGHAGLFSSADDLARFARMLLRGGELDGVRVLAPETVRRMTAPVTVGGGARVTLGWDAPDDPAHAAMSARSFGHEGFTGTSLWIDPARDLFVVFLSSRLHPDGKGRAIDLAHQIRSKLVDSMYRLDRRRVAVLPGIDVLAAEHFRPLAGKRVALLTNDAARNAAGRPTADVLFSAPGVDLRRLLAPEHGLVSSTGLPVEDAFQAVPALDGVDAVVVDLPDVGARFYTYAATLLSVMRAAARAREPVIVLDRPDPIGGTRVEGPLPDAVSEREPVRAFSAPVRHGLTLGEIARLENAHIGATLSVVAARGWRRDMLFEDTGLLWFDPSPNLRSARAALLYPGLALFETTNLSVGRGTPTPFELLGAPWLDAAALARALPPLPGVRVRATDFTPDAAPYRGSACHGLAFDVTDARAVEPVKLALVVAAALVRMQRADWHFAGFNRLLDSRRAFDAVIAGTPPEDIARGFDADVARFRRDSAGALLYPSSGSDAQP